MHKNKICLLLFSGLLIVPHLAHGQQGNRPAKAMNPHLAGKNIEHTDWELYLTSQLIVRLSAPNWQVNKRQLLAEIMQLNSGSDNVELISKNNKLSLVFTRKAMDGTEKITVDTNAAIFASGEVGRARPVDGFDVSTWMQSTSNPHIRNITSASFKGQPVWKVFVKPQTFEPLILPVDSSVSSAKKSETIKPPAKGKKKNK